MERASASSSTSPASSPGAGAAPATAANTANERQMWCCVTKQPHKVSFTFTIEDFLNTTGNMKAGERVTSTSFWADDDDGLQWSLSLCPKGTGEEYENYIMLYLSIVRSNASPASSDIEVNAVLSLLNAKNVPAHSCTMRQKLKPIAGQTSCGLEFISQRSPSSYSSTYLCNGNWVMSCKLTYYTNTNFIAVSGNNSIIRSPPSIKKPPRSLVDDTARLFSSTNHGDVTLRVGQREFRAHKFILIARSPVFDAMFQHDMKEKRTEVVDLVDDMKPEVLQAMLRFIYTDELLTLIESDFDLMKDLLAAADKYQVELLKFTCEQILTRRVSADNCIDVLLLADRHSADTLRQFVLDYICLNPVDVMKTDAWKHLKTQMNVSRVFLDVSEALAARVIPKAL